MRLRTGRVSPPESMHFGEIFRTKLEEEAFRVRAMSPCLARTFFAERYLIGGDPPPPRLPVVGFTIVHCLLL
jgi:hypothetical protein